jgi:hypothetical protein
VISREFTTSGSLLTTRLILKTATLPRWAPKGIVSRSESWIIEESEVDPHGKVVRCLTRNLEHVKAMQVHETQTFSQVGEGCVDYFSFAYPSLNALFQRKTLQTTEARIVSGFGWGLTKQIENYGLARFRKNVQRVRLFHRTQYLSLRSSLQSREGVALILDLIRQGRRQHMAVGSSYLSPTSASRFTTARRSFDHHGSEPHKFPGPDDSSR